MNTQLIAAADTACDAAEFINSIDSQYNTIDNAVLTRLVDTIRELSIKTQQQAEDIANLKKQIATMFHNPVFTGCANFTDTNVSIQAHGNIIAYYKNLTGKTI